uniref:C-type lectin domain-containing protein n=1 Tax=Amphiprion percula TaxID=161767 RepID=A0A3P8RYW4_AMPPE
ILRLSFKNKTDTDNPMLYIKLQTLKLVALSFGLLCILQAVLNISLHLTLSEYENDQQSSQTVYNIHNIQVLSCVFLQAQHFGWVHFSDSVYYVSSTMKNWQESRDDCIQKGADLVIINSREEQEFTRHFRKDIWIGLTDQEMEGKWKWVDGSPLTKSDEDCGDIKFFAEENDWNDKPCHFKNVWMCEKTVAL